MDNDMKYDNSAADLVIEASSSETEIGLEICTGIEQSDPSTIVIVGATGDLTARKLVPALFNLYLNDGLPDSFCIVGCGRTKPAAPSDLHSRLAVFQRVSL